MNHLLEQVSLSGKINRDQHFGKDHQFNEFMLPSKDNDSSSADRTIVDLDIIVEKFIQYMWETTKSKSDKKYEFEDLDIVVNWNKMEIISDSAKFEPKTTGFKNPVNQTLFKTYFTNKTNQVQEYSFKTERTTRQSCGFSFVKGFTREKEASISFKLPEDIVEIGGGIKSEQSVECGKDQTNEEEVTWGCDSMIKVDPFTKTSASLIITEIEMKRDFFVTTYFKGRLIITLNHKKDGFVKSLSADISQVINLANEKLWIPKNSANFEIMNVNGNRLVRSSLHGKCKFRIGLEQHIEINEERF